MRCSTGASFAENGISYGFIKLMQLRNTVGSGITDGSTQSKLHLLNMPHENAPQQMDICLLSMLACVATFAACSSQASLRLSFN